MPTTAVIVGAGHRSCLYASLAKMEPDTLKIVGIAEPDAERRNRVADYFGIPEDRRFATSDELAAVPKFADCAINGTMDHQHVMTTLPLLRAGYDVLLEKPFAINEEEARELIRAAKKYGRKVMTCFVLRYAPFYTDIKKHLLSGEIGDIINIQTNEFVCYHHMAVAYVQGKWNNFERCHSSMLLAKSCHDVDVMMWLMGKDRPVEATSFGNNMQFVEKNAPEGSGTRCLVDCPLVDTCLYSAKRIYIDHPNRWRFYVWDKLEGIENPTIEDKINLLRGDSPYGRCVYKSDNNVVDHQSMMFRFESGATGTHNMIGGAATDRRTIRIIGTKGEIFGELNENKFTVSLIDPSPNCEHRDTVYTSETDGGSHGGGDLLLMRDFLKYVNGEPASISCSSIEDSFAGHLGVFLADKSRENGGRVEKFVFDD